MYYLTRSVAYCLLRIFFRIKHRTLILGKGSEISFGSIFEGYNKVSHHAYVSGEMGRGSYVGEYSTIVGKVGRYCSVGGHVTCLTSTHPTKQFVSTSPCFYSTLRQNGMTYAKEQLFDEFPKIENTKYPVIIGNDVYIGYGAVIIAPVKIGDGAVVAANSVVTKDVEPFTIVGGNPAKLIRKRFSDEEICFLSDFQWWNKDEDWIRTHSSLFVDIRALMNEYKG